MESILSNSTRKLLWFEISKMLIAVKKNKFIVSFIIIFGTLSFPVGAGIVHPHYPCSRPVNTTSVDGP